MKKLIIAGLLAGLLALSGCSSMLERSYESSTVHVDYSVTEDESILRAESYQGLVNSILYFINEHASSGTIRLYNYTGDVETDLADACDEVLHQDPLGAYAVSSLNYDNTRILTYYEVDLQIVYTHTAEDIAAIRAVNGSSGLRRELSRMVSDLRQRAVLRVSYFSGDVRYVEQLFRLALFSDPVANLQPETPVSVVIYPETGTQQRIVEVLAGWPSQSRLTRQAQGTKDACTALMEAFSPAGDSYTVDELAAMLRNQAQADEESGAMDALSALSGEPVNDTGLLMAMEYLCQQTGIEVAPVFGSEGEAPLWLIVGTPDGYRHLLPQWLRPGAELPDGEVLPLYTDRELSEMGYGWPQFLYPVCADYSAPQ